MFGSSLRRSVVVVAACSCLAFAVADAKPEDGRGGGNGAERGRGHAPADISFTDVTHEVGLGSILGDAYSHSAAWGDVDDDGILDLFVGTFKVEQRPSPHRLFLGDGSGFARSAQASIERGGRASGSVLVDLDEDGDLDLVIANNTKEGSTDPVQAEPTRLLRNDGDGVFEDVTDGSGMEAVNRRARSIGVLDHDGDGDLDLLVVADALVGPTGTTKLLRNDGDLTFTDVTAEAGLPTNISGLGVGVADANGDGWPDVAVTGGVAGSGDMPFAEVFLFVNDGDGTFHDATPDGFGWVPRNNEDWTAGVGWGDLNRDGRLDVVVSHHFGSASSQPLGPRVFLNRGNDAAGDPVFEELPDLPPIASKAPHVEIQDFDNDGWPDIYTSVMVADAAGTVVGPYIYRHTGLLDAAGRPSFSSPEPASVAYYAPGGPTADYDHDGQLDVFVDGFDRFVTPTLWRNTTPSGNRWLSVEVGMPGNSHGIGTTVRAYERKHIGDPQRLLGTTEITTGNGYSSAQAPIAHFGLGVDRWVDIEVVRPFGRGVTRRCDVRADQLVVIGPGSPPGRAC